MLLGKGQEGGGVGGFVGFYLFLKSQFTCQQVAKSFRILLN